MIKLKKWLNLNYRLTVRWINSVSDVEKWVSKSINVILTQSVTEKPSFEQLPEWIEGKEDERGERMGDKG